MKIVLLIPDSYTLKSTLENAFINLGHQVITVNYWGFFSPLNNKIFNKTIGLPMRFKRHHFDYYMNKINQEYLRIIHDVNPDLVLIYNDQYLNLHVAKEIKKISKLIFYLGDNPFYLQYRPQYMAPVFYEADYIFSPDSYWLEYFKKTGFHNVELLLPGYDKRINYLKTPTEIEREKFACDLVAVSSMYDLDPWSYKRAKFYNLFTKFNMTIYGHRGWERWFSYFPDLKDKIIFPNEYLSFEKVNTILNCSKIYPIENNVGLINGVHLRVFEAIGSGILPLPEYQKDFSTVFNKVTLPSIPSYDKASEIVNYYLNHDAERANVIKELKDFVDEFITPDIAVQKILSKI